MDKVKIYVATHKETDVCDKKISDIYYKILVGSKGKEIPRNYISDDFKDGISEKNKNYSELTGQYYIWKQDKSDIVGLVHYRRVLSKNLSDINYKALNEKQIKKTLSKYDIIVPKREKMLKHTVETYYSKAHCKKDYDLTRNIIYEKYPEYSASFEKVSKRKYLYLANILITRKELFDEYSEWMFNILFELEKRVEISNYDSYQSRIFGFISERLINVWLDYKGLKIKEYRMINLDQNQFVYRFKKIYYKIKEVFSNEKI